MTDDSIKVSENMSDEFVFDLDIDPATLEGYDALFKEARVVTMTFYKPAKETWDMTYLKVGQKIRLSFDGRLFISGEISRVTAKELDITGSIPDLVMEEDTGE